VTKLNPSGRSTCLFNLFRGAGQDEAFAIAVGLIRSAYVTGRLFSRLPKSGARAGAYAFLGEAYAFGRDHVRDASGRQWR